MRQEAAPALIVSSELIRAAAPAWTLEKGSGACTFRVQTAAAACPFDATLPTYLHYKNTLSGRSDRRPFCSHLPVGSATRPRMPITRCSVDEGKRLVCSDQGSFVALALCVRRVKERAQKKWLGLRGRAALLFNPHGIGLVLCCVRDSKMPS